MRRVFLFLYHYRDQSAGRMNPMTVITILRLHFHRRKYKATSQRFISLEDDGKERRSNPRIKYKVKRNTAWAQTSSSDTQITPRPTKNDTPLRIHSFTLLYCNGIINLAALNSNCIISLCREVFQQRQRRSTVSHCLDVMTNGLMESGAKCSTNQINCSHRAHTLVHEVFAVW